MLKTGDASNTHFQDQRFLLLTAIVIYALYLFQFFLYAHQISHQNLSMPLLLKHPESCCY